MLTWIFLIALLSDQLFAWSDEHSERTCPALRKRRNALVRQLPPLKSILRGSLIERYKRCGKPGCKCADGPGHGPKYYLSVSYPGLRPQMDYVPQECLRANGGISCQLPPEPAKFLEAICEINRELLRRREAL
jgi:hypothetical protein